MPVDVPWATFRTTKAAVKMHTLLDLRGSIPSFIHISEGKLHDVNVLDLLVPEAGATYVMDRAYVDFQRLYALHPAGAFFVTRAKKTFRFHRLYSAATDRTLGVIADQTVALDGLRTNAPTPTACAAFAPGIRNPPKRWCSSPTGPDLMRLRCAASIRVAGRSSCSSNGSSSTCA